MRIAMVSAHYPPNFVSGGTLVPERIANGFAARGHRVSVFAGSINDGRPDLSVRTETTETGVAVHWTTITGMLDWADPINYSNDPIDAEFARWLRRERPEVVHFHNLQGFGGSLVSTAAAAGAAVVVTMHDMWWWCARQFLVDKQLRPCSTVVNCGVCPCEDGNGWLVERDRRLAMHLRNADLVLAPSSTMVDLLSANGVDPGCLALDENPSPDSIREPALRPHGDGFVRFVFAGGRHPLKGAGLVVEAARELSRLPGWRLDLYGAQATGGRSTREDLPPGVRSLPAYDPSTVSTLLARYDVLVMASVMLESYSLLTREALAAGCAVITGDNPGPTEVVKDGVNGLVVARGDAEGFATAMRMIITEPGLLARLQPAPGTLPLRSLDEQLDGLEEHYRRLLGDRPTGLSDGPARSDVSAISNVLIVSGITGAPLRYRGFFPQEALRMVGVNCDVLMYRDADVIRKARTADAVVFYRVPATEQVLDVISMVRARPDPVPVLFDVDDLIFDPGLRGELDPVLTRVAGLDLDLYWQGIRRYRTTLEASDAYIGSTRMLCEQVTAVTGIPAYRWANGVGREVARVSDFELYTPRRKGPVRIGYLSGTNTHNEDWASVEPAIVEVLLARPDVELWLGGLLEPSAALDPYRKRVRRLPLKPWTQLPRVLRDLDINLAPLSREKIFNEAKSAIKWLEAALTRTPTVASASEPFREAIDHRRTGMLADTSADWTRLLIELVDDAGLRHRIGHAARERALLTLSPSQQGYRYLALLERARAVVAEDGHRRQFDNWEPESLSEPYIPQHTDRYETIPALRAGAKPRRITDSDHRTLLRVAADYRTNGMSYLRTEGPVRTAVRAVRVARRLPARVAAAGRR